MRGYADLHCHILPGLDDGAADVADSVEMAAQADRDRIEVIAATPHIRADHDVVIGELPARVAALNAELVDAGLAVRVVTGGEVAAPEAAGLTDEALRGVTLGRGPWVLLEPGPGPMDDALDAAVDALHARGVRCLVAHPERHAGADAAERLAGLVARGALVQVTAAHLAAGPAAPTMLGWAAKGLVHVVSSDAHSSQFGRAATVSEGLDALARVPELAPHLDWIAREAPHAILAGEDVTPPFGPA